MVFRPLDLGRRLRLGVKALQEKTHHNTDRDSRTTFVRQTRFAPDSSQLNRDIRLNIPKVRALLNP